MNISFGNIIIKLLAFSIIGGLYCIDIFGQKDFFQGFVIKNNGDTVHGLINSGGPVANAKYCTFKEDKNSKSIKYSPSELAGYRIIDGKYYISRDISYQLDSEGMQEIEAMETNRKSGMYTLTVKTVQTDTLLDGYIKNGLIHKKVFLEFLINGMADFYVYFDPHGDAHYFTNLDKDSLVKLQNTNGVIRNQYNDDYFVEKKEYIGQLNYLLGNCEGIYTKITSTNLQNNSLIKLAKYYHEKTCTSSDEQCIVYEKKNIKTHITISPVIGYSIFTVSASELTRAYEYEFNDYRIVSFGALFNFSNLQYLNDNISFQFGLILQKQHFESEDKATTMDFSILNVPFGIKYTFLLNSKIRPNLGISACSDFRLKMNTETEYQILLPELKTSPFSYSGQIGFDYVMNEKFSIISNAQYRFGKSFYSRSVDKSKFHEFIIQMGLGYKINHN